jgi:Protein of unknown function (DUF1566)
MRTQYTTGVKIALAAALLVGASTAHAALRTENCLAKKRGAQGKLQQCRATEDAKALQGKPANLGKCGTKFQEKIAKLDEKASDAGIGCRYRDNGDGTVSDYDTGLQWEKKDIVAAGSGVHYVSNSYSWGISTATDGTAFTFVLSHLNACSSAPGFFGDPGFASYCDWRLPTLAELQTILLEPNPCGTSPCIDPIFGPTAAEGYWTSTTNASTSGQAWVVFFDVGNLVSATKSNLHHVRAVRGGL